MDTAWVLEYLREARDLVDKMGFDAHGNDLRTAPEAQAEFNQRLLHLRAVISRIAPGLEHSLVEAGTSGSLDRNPRALDQAICTLQEGAEVLRHVGPPAGPALRADTLHPIVWDAAKSFWRSNHRAAAVDAEALAVNAMLLNAVGRRDLSKQDARQAGLQS